MREASEAMAEQRKHLGQRIAEARTAKRWKQKELAAAVHVEPTTVSRWETGRHAPDIDVLEEIARVTDRPMSFFVDSVAPASTNGHGEERWQREMKDEIRRGFQKIDDRLKRIEEGQRAAAATRSPR